MKRHLRSIQTASLVLAGMGTIMSFSPAAFAQTTTHTSFQGEYRFSFGFGHGSTNSTSASQTTQQPSTPTLPTGTQESENWAGYIDAPTSGAMPFTSVSGSWKVPTITGRSNSLAAQWVGLGGAASNDLLQVGTTEAIEGGKEVANVFWEELPSAATDVMTVPVGSTVTASVDQQSGSNWDVSFTATSPTGAKQTQTIPVTLSSSYAQGIGTSAEWINEDPSTVNNQLFPFANSGTVSFTSSTVDGGAINASGNQVTPVAIASSTGNAILDYPSALGTDGESFTTTAVNGGRSTSSFGHDRFTWGNGFGRSHSHSGVSSNFGFQGITGFILHNHFTLR